MEPLHVPPYTFILWTWYLRPSLISLWAIKVARVKAEDRPCDFQNNALTFCNDFFHIRM